MAGALSTDLYELTMPTSYLRRGMTGPATFSLFARQLPAERGFLVSAGLADCLDHLVRKLGVPFQPELAMGAIGEGDVVVYNDRVVERARVSPEELAEVRAREQAELDHRARRYRGSRTAADLTGRSAVVVDDGIATGATARAACLVARARGARRVVLAAPVAVTDSVQSLRDVADEIVCLYLCAPGSFFGVGQFYRDFAATSDSEVGRLLDESPRNGSARRAQ